LVGSCLADDKQILPRDGGLLMAINPSNHAAGDPRSQKRVPIEEAKEAPRVARPPIPGGGGFAPDPISKRKSEKSDRKEQRRRSGVASQIIITSSPTAAIPTIRKVHAAASHSSQCVCSRMKVTPVKQ
jgi:hypothetical protein